MPASLLRVWVATAALWWGAVVGARQPPLALALAAILLGATGSLRRRSALAPLGLALLAFGAGMLVATVRAGDGGALERMSERVPTCRIRGRILEPGGPLGTPVAVDEARCEGFDPVVDAGVATVEDLDGAAGSEVRAGGWLVPLGDDAFGAARRRLGARAAFDPVELTVEPPDRGPPAVAAAIREGMARSAAGLGSPRAGLLLGLTIGDTSELDEATTESFRRAGLSHLLAVSGSNVAIVLGAVGFAVSGLGLRTRLGAGALALGLFVLVVGPEPSVLRAAVMGYVGLAALASGRRVEPLYALGLALLVLVAVRPLLVFSVGLYLSAAATAGLVLWTGPLARRLGFLPRPLALVLAATLSAQAAVAPILLGVFGEVSVAAPLANAVAIPAVAPATVLGLVSGVVGSLAPQAGAWLAQLAGPFVSWIVFVGERLGGQPWSSLQAPAWCGWIVAVPVALAAAAALIAEGAATS